MMRRETSCSISGGAEFRSRIRRLSLVLAAIGLLVAPVGAFGQSAALQDLPNQDVAREAIGQLRSPYCPGFMLEVCPSPQAEALRDSIFMLAAQGESSDAIVEWMIGNHGEEWRGMPKRSGAGLLAWIIPPIALLAGIGGFLFWLKSSRNPERVEPEVADDSGMSEAERSELAAAMRNWESTPQDDQ